MNVATIAPAARLGTTLTEYLDGAIGQDTTILLPAVNKIVEAGYLQDHLTRILASPALINDLEAEAHPNGFSKIRLATHHGKWVLRLHVWHRPDSQAQIHSHRWNFASRILSGSLTTRTYRISSDSGPRKRWLCHRQPPRGYVFRAAGDCEVELIAERVCPRHVSYLQPFEHLHTLATDVGLPVATVVLQGPDIARDSTVITEPGQQRMPAELPVAPLRSSQILSLIRLVRRLSTV
jgi:hypothetical protein